MDKTTKETAKFSDTKIISPLHEQRIETTKDAIFEKLTLFRRWVDLNYVQNSSTVINYLNQEAFANFGEFSSDDSMMYEVKFRPFFIRIWGRKIIYSVFSVPLIGFFVRLIFDL